jgi:hypothetical protein
LRNMLIKTESKGFSFAMMRVDAAYGTRVCEDDHFWAMLSRRMQCWVLNAEIYYFQHKGPRSYGAVEEWVGTRRYFVQQREKNMYQINMPKSAKKSKLIAHRSESGWNLPHTDDNHFFKFPLGKESQHASWIFQC